MSNMQVFLRQAIHNSVIMKYTFMIILTLPSLWACGQTKLLTKEGLSPHQAAKDYFLCKCIYEGYKQDSLFRKDGSQELYFEYLKMNIQTLDSVAKSVAQRGAVIRTYTGRNGVFADCLEYYKSDSLDKLIYMYKRKQ